MRFTEEKKGQVTIFIIIAIVLVAGLVFYFVAWDNLFAEEIPSTLQPAYNGFLVCLEEQTLFGANILAQQGGYIELPEFVPGSSYMPFSSQLDFAGVPVPYWYYVDYAGTSQEQVPSLKDMEGDFEDFLERQIQTCNFDIYYEDEFDILFEEANTEIEISGGEILVKVDMDLSIAKAGEDVVVKKHEIIVDSELGNLYEDARGIYELEQEDLFLEKYGVDTLRLYAPVDGVEFSCSPEIWSADQVFQDLRQAIEMNTFALGTPGNVVDKYFEFNSNYEVNFLNSQSWAYAIEVSPNEGNLLVAEPVGNTPGMGILGFCYVPYHYVYNVYYPVLVQVSSGEEIFQFPMAVVIEGNKEREAIPAIAGAYESEVCKYQDTQVNIRVYDDNLKAINADISYDCLGEKCGIGTSGNGSLMFPQCVNGYLVAKADGYVDASVLLTTVNGGSMEVIMDKLYELDVELELDSRAYNGEAMVSFISPEVTQTIFYPGQSTIELAAGDYDVQVQIYEETSLDLGATTQEQCVEVPRSGVFGIIGFTEEECYQIEIPEQTVTNVLAGGGKQNVYVLESSLATANAVVIDADSLPSPTSLNQVQDNYILFEEKEVSVRFI